MKLETSADLLERVRAKHGASWYRLAKMLPAHENTVYSWKAGHTIVDRKFAPRLAALLDEPAEYVLACLEHEKEQSAEVRKLWARIAAKFRSHAASILLAVLLGPALFVPGSQGVRGAMAEDASRALYIMVSRLWRWLRRPPRVIPVPG